MVKKKSDIEADIGILNQDEKDERIRKEIARLRRICSKIDPKRKATAEGLIRRAAFMRVSLAVLEADLLEKGFTELFSQGEQAPYDRKRPAAEIYNSMNTSYQKIMKQLSDLLPKEAPPPDKGDGFDDFVIGREDD